MASAEGDEQSRTHANTVRVYIVLVDAQSHSVAFARPVNANHKMAKWLALAGPRLAS